MSKLILLPLLVLLCQLILCRAACVTPTCTATSNCETVNYLKNHKLLPTSITVSFEPPLVINPSTRTSTLPEFSAFQDFEITDSDDFNTDHIIDLQAVGNDTAPCLLDNPGQPECQYKLVTTRHDLPELHCGWEYQCNYQKNRIPQYIWEAKCTDPSQENIQSIPVYYKIPILELSSESNPGDCNPFERSDLGVWKWKQLEVPVACTCAPA